jgi:hypothetical protein
MNKKNKVSFKARRVLQQARLFFLAGIALTIAVPSAMAQNQLSARPESITSTATQGLWGNEVDHFMDVNDYDTVEFDKFYGLLQGGDIDYSPSQKGSSISGGFAKNFGSIYLGLYYTGNLARGISIETKDAGGNRIDSAPDTGILSDNELQVLIGTPVGGFKLALVLANFSTNTDETPTQTVKNKAGGFGATLTWGKNFALGSGLLKPEVEAGYYFNLAKVETTNKSTGETVTTRNGESSKLLAGLRATYEFAPGASSQSSLTLEDTINISFPTNPLEKSSLDPVQSRDQEGNKIENTLDGSFAKTYDLDERFSAGWLVGLSFGVTLDPVKETYTSPGGVTSTNSDVKTTTVTLTPRAGVGFTYKFVPERFTLNGGVTASYEYELEKVKNNVSNVETTTRTLGSDDGSYFGGWTVNSALGGTLYFNPKVFLDFAAGVGVSNGYFNANVSNLSLLVSVRN